jgi:hypothetical protein
MDCGTDPGHLARWAKNSVIARALEGALPGTHFRTQFRGVAGEKTESVCGEVHTRTIDGYGDALKRG